MDWTSLLSIAISLVLIGFFSGIEAAFVSANQLPIELRKKQGLYSGKVWGEYSDNPSPFIGSVLVGFNLMLVVFVLSWSKLMNGFWYNPLWNINNVYLHLFIETIIAGFFMIFTDFIFKAFFKAKNDAIIGSGFIARIANLLNNFFSYAVSFFITVSEWILKFLFNVKLNDKKEAFTKLDLDHFINQSKTHDDEDNSEINKELFENALSLRELKVRECLIPRKEIESVDISASIDFVKEKFIKTKLSKLVVYDKNIDTILGYVHQLDFFKRPSELRSVLLPIFAVPESMSATGLLNNFSKERKSIAWVVDEFGGTAGIVTMEDLLEEIFGDINDEYDTEEFIEKQLSTNEFIFSGRLELDFITDKYDLQFPQANETETLSGFIIQNRDDIPKQKESFTIGHYQFDILNVSDTRIETVKLKVLK